MNIISSGKFSKETSHWNVNGENFELYNNFKVLDYLGSGAYGVVCSAYDTTNNSYIAIKKCKKIFHSRTIAKRTLRELRLLRNLDHENIIKLNCILPPTSDTDFCEIYVVFEIMETDLATIIKSKQTLLNEHIQIFMYQLFNALIYLHNSNILHRDLKPRNLLVNSNCMLKVADFGLSRVYHSENERKIVPMTEYITTRWYRAPEILVGWHKYTNAIDMWAAGTILAELLGRKAIFPGVDSLNQIELIVSKLGRPPESFIQSCKKIAFRHKLREFPMIPPLSLERFYPAANAHSLSLLSKLLELDPLDRISASDAIRHSYFKPIREDSTPITTKSSPELTLPIQDFLFEDRENTTEDLKAEILKEIYSYNKPFLSHKKQMYHLANNTAEWHQPQVEIKEFENNNGTKINDKNIVKFGNSLETKNCYNYPSKKGAMPYKSKNYNNSSKAMDYDSIFIEEKEEDLKYDDFNRLESSKSEKTNSKEKDKIITYSSSNKSEKSKDKSSKRSGLSWSGFMDLFRRGKKDSHS